MRTLPGAEPLPGEESNASLALGIEQLLDMAKQGRLHSLVAAGFDSAGMYVAPA